MAKVLTRKQGEEIVLREREEAALAELKSLHFQVGLYEPRTFVEPDILRGVEGGWRVGVCHVTAHSTKGTKKTVTGVSAVQALDEVRVWLRYQERRSPELRFVISPAPKAPAVTQRPGSEEKRRQDRENVHRRELSFSPTGELIEVKESK